MTDFWVSLSVFLFISVKAADFYLFSRICEIYVTVSPSIGRQDNSVCPHSFRPYCRTGSNKQFICIIIRRSNNYDSHQIQIFIR